MTNREWTLLIAKEFNVSNTVAKGMLHAMYEAKKYLSVNLNVQEEQKKQKEQKEAKEKFEKEFKRRVAEEKYWDEEVIF